jgi:UDP-2,3-diacylglucosamine pyrophosphatase LpxH
MHDQMADFAESARKAIAADRVIILGEFFDQVEDRPATLMVFADDTDQDEAQTFAELAHALLKAAQTVLSQTGTELVLRDRKTGELTEFKIWKPHALELTTS